MSNLIAVAYHDVDTARAVAAELEALTKEKSIELDDMVVVERKGDGSVKLHQAGSPTASGAAVVVLVRRTTPDKVLPRISKYGGDVIQSSLDREAEDQLDTALAG